MLKRWASTGPEKSRALGIPTFETCTAALPLPIFAVETYCCTGAGGGDTRIADRLAPRGLKVLPLPAEEETAQQQQQNFCSKKCSPTNMSRSASTTSSQAHALLPALSVNTKHDSHDVTAIVVTTSNPDRFLCSQPEAQSLSSGFRPPARALQALELSPLGTS